MMVFYLAGGINHVLHPETYDALVLPYLSFHFFINPASGFAEIVFGGAENKKHLVKDALIIYFSLM